MRAFFGWIHGFWDSKASKLSENEYVMGATYDASIEKKIGRISTIKTAVENEIRIRERKALEVKNLTQEIAHKQELMDGALAKAKSVAAQLQSQGKTAEQIKADQDYIVCQSGYNNLNTAVGEKQSRLKALENEIAEANKQIGVHKAWLQSVQREIEKLKQEKHEAIADVQINREAAAIADVLSGISRDDTDQDLIAAREARQNVKARAQVSSELAGNDVNAAEEQFLQFARQSASASKFDALIGLEADKPEVKTAEPAKLVEA
jgi:archaellum component FlaC